MATSLVNALAPHPRVTAILLIASSLAAMAFDGWVLP